MLTYAQVVSTSDRIRGLEKGSAAQQRRACSQHKGISMDNNDVPKKILVVDDEEVTVELAKTFLEKHGFAVVCAGDGEEALAVAYDEQPDLILLDVMLPKLDGFEVCKKLKSDSRFEHVPILMFTARGFDRDMRRGREAGADEYIVKPFAGKALVATIRKHLGLAS